MRLGIDLDDTIINTYKDMIAHFSEYFNIDLDICRKNKYSYNNYPEEIKDRIKEFIKYTQEKNIIANISVKEKAKETIDKLRSKGHKIIIITSRNDNYFKNSYEITRKYLKDNNINYDKLFCEHDKHKILIEEKIDIFIDDSIKSLEYNKDACKYHILFNSEVNKDTKNDFRRVYNWDELYEVINEIEGKEKNDS